LPGEGPQEMKTRVEATVQNSRQSYSITNGAPSLLCEDLSRRLGHEVVDKTGLTGRYDFELSFESPGDPNQIAAALRERYGLDLQSSQQPVKIFAVDNVEMPQGN
jgi:uncharacterized protein (TIGR03435 family)